MTKLFFQYNQQIRQVRIYKFTKSILFLLFLCFNIAPILIAQTNCRTLLKQATAFYETGDLQQAKNQLKLVEKCDTKNKLLKKRLALLDKLFTSLEQQGEQAELTSIANDLAHQAALLLASGERTTAYQLAVFAHQFVDTTDNNKVAQVVADAYYYNDIPNSYDRTEEKYKYRTRLHPLGLQQPWSRSYYSNGLRRTVLSPNGKLLALIHKDNSVKILEVESGKELGRFEAYAEYTPVVAFSPDNRYLFSQSRSSINVWDLNTKKRKYRLSKHQKDIWYILFSPNGQYMLSSSTDHTAKLWDTESGDLIHNFKTEADYAPRIAFSPNGEFILTSNGKKDAILWETLSGNKIHILEDNKHPTTVFTFSPDGQYILTGGSGGNLSLWGVKNGRHIQNIKAHSRYENIDIITYSPDGRYVATGSRDKKVKIWDVEKNFKELHVLRHSFEINAISFSQDSKHLVTSSSYGLLARRWNVRSGKEVSRFNDHHGSVSAEFFPDGQQILTKSSDETIRIWRTESKKKLKNITAYLGFSGGDFFALSHDGQYLLTADIGDDEAVLWDVKSGKELRKFKTLRSIYSLAFSSDNKYVLAGGYYGAKLWDLSNGVEIDSFPKINSSIDAVGFSPDNKQVILGELKGARFWNIASGETVQTIKWPSADNIRFSSDGKYILTGNYGHRGVSLWNTKTGERVHHKGKHDSYSMQVAISPNNKYFIMGGYFDKVTLNDLARGKEICILEEFDSERFGALAFSPDSKYALIPEKESGNINLVNVETCKIIRQIKWFRASKAFFSHDGRFIYLNSEDTFKSWDLNTDSIIAAQHRDFPLTAITPVNFKIIKLDKILEKHPIIWQRLIHNADHYLLASMGDYFVDQMINNNNSTTYNNYYSKAENCYQRAIQDKNWGGYYQKLGELYQKWGNQLYKNGLKKEAETKQQKAKELLDKAVKKQAIEWKEFKQKNY